MHSDSILAQQGLLNDICGRKSQVTLKRKKKDYVPSDRNTVQKLFLYLSDSIFNNALGFFVFKSYFLAGYCRPPVLLAVSVLIQLLSLVLPACTKAAA